MGNSVPLYVISHRYLSSKARDRVDRDHYDLVHWTGWTLNAAVKTSLVSLFIGLAMRQFVAWLPLVSVALLVLWLILSSRLDSIRETAAQMDELVRVDDDGITLFGHLIPGHLITGVASVGRRSGEWAHLIIFLTEKVEGGDLLISQSVGAHSVIGTTLVRFLGPEGSVVRNQEILQAAAHYGVPTRVFDDYAQMEAALID